ncbi:MAG: cobyrinate a,c-diamide synthase, partial [Eubacteriales bacterium]
IIAALKKMGYQVASFKAGPDYIDSGFHEKVSERPCINLDAWICGQQNLPYLFDHYGSECDIGIVEGVMGLYDGLACDTIACSSAHVANTIGLPVILVVDGSGVSLSAAAIVRGFIDFDTGTTIAGVIFNRVSGEEHYRLLKKAVESRTNAKCIGYLPAIEGFSMSERHLGLVPACETEGLNDTINQLAQSVLQNMDMQLLLNLCRQTPKAALPEKIQTFIQKQENHMAGKRIGIAMDEAFHFYYKPNIDLLMTGAKITYFSPLHDQTPPDVDALYIGGGFPEVFAQELDANDSFRAGLKRMLEADTPCYAECGGLMYLCDRMEDMGGELRRMVGFFSHTVRMTRKLQRFGYAVVTTKTGQTIHAHEFHCSVLEDSADAEYYFEVSKPDGSQSWPCGLRKQNTIAGYPHLYFWDNPEVISELFLKHK